MGRYYETFPAPFVLTYDPTHRPLLVNADAYDRSDLAIISDVRARLAQLADVGGIDTSHVHATSSGQVLRFSGDVATAAVVRFMSGLGESILGVREIENELQVRRAGASAAGFTSHPAQGYPTPSSPYERETPSNETPRP